MSLCLNLRLSFPLVSDSQLPLEQQVLIFLQYVPWIITFAVCETWHCVSLHIFDDFVDESNVVFGYTLERAFGLHPRITIKPDVGEVQAHDNNCLYTTEDIRVGYEFNGYRTNEGQLSSLILLLEELHDHLLSLSALKMAMLVH